MAYATVEDVQARIDYTLSETQTGICENLLEDAGVMIDSYNENASGDTKKTVSCRMVIRALGADSSSASVPIGSTQGSMSALGYSQSWTMGAAGSTGELYISKLEKRLLGADNAIGSHSPTEDLTGWWCR